MASISRFIPTALLILLSAIMWSAANASPHNVITDSHGFTWLAGEKGLMRSDGYDTVPYHTHSGITEISRKHITELQTDTAGNIWMLADGEYLILNPAQATIHPLANDFDRLGLPQMPSVVRLAGADTWFVISGGGVYRLSPGKKTFKMPDKGLAERNITDLLLLSEQNTAYAIDNLSHIYIFDYNTGWVRSHSQNPLANTNPTPYTLSLLPDSTTVIVSTPSESYTYSTADNRWAHTHDTIRTATASARATRLKAPRILLSAINFHGPAPTIRPAGPEYTSGLTIPSQNANFTIRFSLAGSPSNSIEYTYQLVGFDRHPVTIPSGAHSATFANIPPGSYTLHIHAADNTYPAITATRSLPIVITGPWYTSSASRILFILAGILLLCGLLHLTRLHERRRWHTTLGHLPVAPQATAVPGLSRTTPTSISSPCTPQIPKNNALVIGDITDIPPLPTDMSAATVHTPTEAIATLSRESSVSIILLSPSIPLAISSNLTRIIRSNRATLPIPIILLTSHTDTHLVEGLSLCADSIIYIPRQRHLLTDKIHTLIQLRHNGLLHPITTPPTPDTRITPSDCTLLHKAVRHISAAISHTDLTVEQLARELHISRIHLYNRISAITGRTPIEFIRLIRLRRAAAMLLHTQKSSADIAAELGFGNPKTFIKYFREEYTLTPHDYRITHQNEAQAPSDAL